MPGFQGFERQKLLHDHPRFGGAFGIGQVIARISELGVGFSLDDFGTGYSSLAQLRRLPVSTLKIDRSFVMNMADNEEDANIVRSTIELGHSLHLSVVAEGVEDPALLAQLEEYGCDIAQGFHLSRPIPQEQVPGWLGEHRPAEDQASASSQDQRLPR